MQHHLGKQDRSEVVINVTLAMRLPLYSSARPAYTLCASASDRLFDGPSFSGLIFICK